eukprot:107245_1
MILLLLMQFGIKLTQSDDRSYHFVNIPMTSGDAEAYCQSTYGTTLATVATDNDKIAAINAYANSATDVIWIGITKENNPGWVWLDGTVCSGDPYYCVPQNWWINTFENSDCGVMHLNNNGLFNDWHCNNANSNFTFLCNALCNELVCATHLVCVNGACQRDCNAFKIDDFLVDCSSEFAGNENDILTLQSNITRINTRLDAISAGIATTVSGINQKLDELEDDIDINEANISRLEIGVIGIKIRLDGIDSSVSTINGRLDSNEGDIQSINASVRVNKGDILALQAAIIGIKNEMSLMSDQLAKYPAAHSQNIQPHTHKTAPNAFLTTNSKDWLMIYLLVLNTFTIIGGICAILLCIYGSKNSKYSKYINVKAYSSGDEHQQLSR